MNDDTSGAPTQAELDRAVLERLVVNDDMGPFVARAKEDPSFPFETDVLVALKLYSEQKPRRFELLRRGLKAGAPEVRLRALEDAMRKTGARAGGAANADGEF
jgi:hypothetical protein